jgi:ABC-type multidrug transport system fused ATPase/permease subunit
MSFESTTIEKLQTVFQRLLPLVDDLADALGILLLISLAIIVWVFVYFFHLHHFSLVMSLGVVGLAIIPVLILTRFWFALENLKDIPKIAEEMMDDVTEDVAQSWHAIKSGKKGALNFFGQAKKLFEIRSLLNSADNILEQYFSIGPLVNPFYLFFGVLSLFALLVLFLTGIVLGLFSVFS